MLGAPPRLGAVMVHYGDPSPTRRAIEDVVCSRGVDIRWVLVDHGPRSGEDLRAAVEARGGIYVRPERNLGFGGGVNRGLDALRSRGPADAFLLLNHDVFLDPSAALVMARRLLEDPRVGVVGPALLDGGRPDRVWNAGSEVEWPRGRPRSLFHGRPAEDLPAAPYDVDFVCGCALLVRVEALLCLGPFPEEYFLYFEDAEFCYRARRAGYRILLEPEARARHEAGRAAEAHRDLLAYCRARNRLVFSRRWAPPGLGPQIARARYAAGLLLGGRAARRGALDGLCGALGAPPEAFAPERETIR